jgi:hypothetical protein
MNTKNREKRASFGCHGQYVGAVNLPVVGYTHLRASDGRAILLPRSGGVIVRDWFAFCRWARRKGVREFLK